jgi:ferredoxin-thioredoxin reductase catalytic chain
LKKKNKEDVQHFANMVAGKQGWKLNPDLEITDTVILGLQSMFNQYGYYHCPCREVEKEETPDRAISCPCIYAKQDILDYGHCYCGFFLAENFKGEAGAIPDRHPD